MRQPHPALLVSALLGLALAAGAAAAGENHGSDFFAGYSFARIDDVNRHGANLALGFDLPGPLSGFVDTSFHWGKHEGGTRSDRTLMAGPGLRFGKRGGTVYFARALAGLVRDRESYSVLDVEISETESRLGAMAGAGVDFKLSSTLVGRLQGDFLWNDVERGKSSGFRASAGIVYRFASAR